MKRLVCLLIAMVIVSGAMPVDVLASEMESEVTFTYNPSKITQKDQPNDQPNKLPQTDEVVTDTLYYWGLSILMMGFGVAVYRRKRLKK